MTQHIIVSGSSITDDGPWPTWATWLSRMFGWSVTNVSLRGIGNEMILLQAINAAKKVDSGTVTIMVPLTSVDKWDWYVQRDDIIKDIDRQKHPTRRLDPRDPYGFWCTGSWFPEWKQHYGDNYLSVGG